ncbi:ABC1 kinase family protein [Actinomarinicola tropica]|uniref:Phosphotransferase n=1 Tax=Actinomarinicola tropica TaxID=2789776 RepID=A0A5Q2RIR3_9ACTN|nr:AarF/UbiB family protein [Actinomarinicola tropica]QGG94276.1 phosphotransferase [Actinomarinicola tropica]
MSTSLRVGHLGRYARIAALLVKHGRSATFGPLGDPPPVDADDDLATEEDARALVDELESMGPTFVKLGQALSTRADLLPPVYLDALADLRDAVEPIPFAEVEQVVERELGVRMSQGFRSFDHEPLASASLGQVHRAVLRDGRPVAVKVQRPEIRERVVDDMDVIEELAGFAADHTRTGRQLGFRSLAREFRRTTMAELDYRREASNLRLMGEHLAELDLIWVPQPIDDYTTSAVLTMELVEGRSVAALTPVGRLDVDGAALAEQLFRAYLEQILLHGFLHADPHPGNVMLTDDGRLGLIDLGMVAHLDEATQDHVIRLLGALSDGDAPKVAVELREMSTPLDSWDETEFRERIGHLVHTYRTITMAELDAGRVVGELAAIAADCGLRPPSTLTLVGKALLNLDHVVRLLDPELDPNELIERHVASIVERRMMSAASPAALLSLAMEGKEFVERLPGRVNKVMDALAEGQMTLNVRGIDEAELMRTARALANRLTSGLVVAALIIGAAMLMRIESDWTILGYPGIAMVLFLVASLLGLWLVVTSIMEDR